MVSILALHGSNPSLLDAREPGTHPAVARRGALLGTANPLIEVRPSNVHRREPFRHHTYFSDAASGTVAGPGALGCELAYHGAFDQLAAR